MFRWGCGKSFLCHRLNINKFNWSKLFWRGIYSAIFAFNHNAHYSLYIHLLTMNTDRHAYFAQWNLWLFSYIHMALLCLDHIEHAGMTTISDELPRWCDATNHIQLVALHEIISWKHNQCTVYILPYFIHHVREN